MRRIRATLAAKCIFVRTSDTNFYVEYEIKNKIISTILCVASFKIWVIFYFSYYRFQSKKIEKLVLMKLKVKFYTSFNFK